MKAVNEVVFDVSGARALISAMSSLHNFIRSQVILLLEPRLSYFSTRARKSFSTLVHPSMTTLSRASQADGGDGTRGVSSYSLSTACNDRTSPLMLRKLSVDPLPVLRLPFPLSMLQDADKLSKKWQSWAGSVPWCMHDNRLRSNKKASRAVEIACSDLSCSIQW